jgi:hypothetical protein
MWQWTTSSHGLGWGWWTWPRLWLSTESGGTGIDPTTFWLILVAMGSAISGLAGLVYKSERDRRIDAESKLEQYRELSPGLAEDVEWLVAEAESQRIRDRQELPWPLQRERPRRPSTKRPPVRKRPP